ncbi:MAG: VF530 family protein [Verrucomicrobiia bacterium]|tara:strand:+ start:3334 stop:3615 length:282 start_codon:yes stop_codon:yes gene_type:complete
MEDKPKSNDPLHGMTLKAIVTDLVEELGWENLGERIPVRCFTHDPSIKSSLTFLRKTPWARTKVENMWMWRQRLKQRARGEDPPSREFTVESD